MFGGQLRNTPQYQPQRHSTAPMRTPGWRFLRDMPGCQEFYDPNARPPAHILAAIQRYDPAVVLRFNRGYVDSRGREIVPRRWEVWRFKGSSFPSNPARVTPDEWARRAHYCFTVEDHKPDCLRGLEKRCTCGGIFAHVDDRARRALWWGDLFRRVGLTTKALAKHLDRQDADQEAETERRLATATDDWMRDDARILDEAMGRSRPIFNMGLRRK